MRTKLNEIIKNGHLGMIAVFFIVYMITFSYIEDRDVHHYIIHTTIDDQIPFCEYFHRTISIMVLICSSYSFILCFNKNQWKEYYQLIITLGTGTDPVFDHLISISEWTGSKTSSYWRQHFIKAVQMIYHTDTPTNVLPSIHVFNSGMLRCDFEESEKI